MTGTQGYLDHQRELQQRSFGVDPTTLIGENQIAYIKEMLQAAGVELHEALEEIGWRSWASSRHVNREAFIGELIDVLHFWMNAALAVGATGEELEAAYFDKAARNAKRQADGYDGVTEKCACGRALDDVEAHA